MCKDKVLVVDDDHSQIELVRALLPCYHIIEATTGKEALDILALGEPDCIILDYLLPDMNGQELFKEIRGAGHRAPVIVVTNYETTELTRSVFRAGVDDCMSKLEAPASLLNVVIETIAAYKAQRDTCRKLEDGVKKLKEI